MLGFLALFLVLSVLHWVFSVIYLVDIQSMVRCIIVQILEAVFAFNIDDTAGMQQRDSGLHHASPGGKIWVRG